MPSQSEKEKRKELLNRLKVVEKNKFLDFLPIDKQQFQDLFDFLDNELEEGCNLDFQITEKFLNSKNLPVSKILNWLKENGGYCDCELLFNVEEKFKD
jgi:hypothetical protein